MFSFEDYTFLVYLMQLQQNAINGLTEQVSSAPQQWHELEQLVYISEWRDWNWLWRSLSSGFDFLRSIPWQGRGAHS